MEKACLYSKDGGSLGGCWNIASKYLQQFNSSSRYQTNNNDSNSHSTSTTTTDTRYVNENMNNLTRKQQAEHIIELFAAACRLGEGGACGFKYSYKGTKKLPGSEEVLD